MIPQRQNLYGKVLNSQAINELILVETAYKARLELPEHSHEFAYFCLVLQGSYTEKYGRRDRLCQASSLIFHPSGESHSNRFENAGGRCFNLQLGQTWLRRWSERSAALNNPAAFAGGFVVQLAARLWRESQSIDELSPMVIEGLTLEIIAEASRSHKRNTSSKPPSWLERTKELIHTDFSSQTSLSSLAESVGVHPVHLARAFRQHYRCTIGEYIRQVRIEFASQKITNSDTPLAMIAAAAGFSDQSHFCKTFKRFTGQTPAEFRKNARFT